MTTNEDKFGALFMLASLRPASVTEAHGHYIVAFEGTSATLMFKASETTLTEIEDAIAEARS